LQRRIEVWIVVLCALLVAPLSCYEGPGRNERYCNARCRWIQKCSVEEVVVTYEQCRSDCKQSLKQEPLAQVCNAEVLDYYICGYENAAAQDCAEHPVHEVIDGCEYAHQQLEECQEQHAQP
jgi:hypothetical protein